MRTTIEAYFKNKLIDHGLWENEADAVLEIAKKDLTLVPMAGRWADASADYSTGLLNTVWLSIKDVALTHLRATAPQHFALGLLQ